MGFPCGVTLLANEIPRIGKDASIPAMIARVKASLRIDWDSDSHPALLHSMLPGADGDVRQHAEQQRCQHIMEKAGK